MRAVLEGMERHQVPIYVGAILAGLVEVIGMVGYVRVVPRLVPGS